MNWIKQHKVTSVIIGAIALVAVAGGLTTDTSLQNPPDQIAHIETKKPETLELPDQEDDKELLPVPTPTPAPTPPPPPKPEPQQPSCDPNYTGGCVPIDYDVDCASGSGDGPSYVSGPVTVVGYDKYGLDRDGDGVGCDS